LVPGSLTSFWFKAQVKKVAVDRACAIALEISDQRRTRPRIQFLSAEFVAMRQQLCHGHARKVRI
jgi:hypothetical protein